MSNPALGSILLALLGCKERGVVFTAVVAEGWKLFYF
jgi:hypothetical protein